MNRTVANLPAPPRVVAAIVGVAALFMPWLAGDRFGATAVAGFVVAAVLVALMAVTATAVGSARDGAAGFVRATLGPPPARAIGWYYIIGVSVGQAVVATVGGLLVRSALDAGTGGWPVAALAVLVAATVAAMVPAVRAVATAAVVGPVMCVVVVVAAAVALSPAGGVSGSAGPPAPGGVDPTDLPAAMFLVLFAFVGAESVLRLPGRPLALAAAVVVAGLGYLVATALIVAGGASPGGRPAPLPVAPFGHGPAGRAVALVAAGACLVGCVRNLAAVASLLADSGIRVAGARPGIRTATLAPALVAAVGVVLIGTHRLDLVDVLAVPNAMALTIFLTICVGTMVAGRGLVRAGAGLAVVGFAGLVPSAWPAVLSPAAVLLTHLVVHYRREGLVHAPD